MCGVTTIQYCIIMM